MSIFTKVVGYTAHKTTKVAKGSGGFVKNFVSEVKADMKTFEEVDNLKSQKEMQRNMVTDGDKEAEIRKKANEGSLKLGEFADYMEDKFAE